MTQKEVVKNTKFNLDNSYLKLSDIFFTIQDPSSVPSPKLVALNYSLINSLGLDSKFLQSNDGVEILAGNTICTSICGTSIWTFYYAWRW